MLHVAGGILIAFLVLAFAPSLFRLLVVLFVFVALMIAIGAAQAATREQETRTMASERQAEWAAYCERFPKFSLCMEDARKTRNRKSAGRRHNRKI